MTDLSLAIQNLNGHSVCFCKNGELITDDAKGIAPLLRIMESGTNLSGYSVADRIVGKAAAMLFVKAGIVSVHGKVMSKAGKAFLEEHGIPCSCDALTDSIINRTGTDICPMEKTVAGIDDIEEGYLALQSKVAQLRQAQKK